MGKLRFFSKPRLERNEKQNWVSDRNFRSFWALWTLKGSFELSKYDQKVQDARTIESLKKISNKKLKVFARETEAGGGGVKRHTHRRSPAALSNLRNVEFLPKEASSPTVSSQGGAGPCPKGFSGYTTGSGGRVLFTFYTAICNLWNFPWKNVLTRKVNRNLIVSWVEWTMFTHRFWYPTKYSQY